MMNVTKYPLCWPEHMPRHRAPEKSRFKATLPAALKNVSDSLRLFASDSGIPVNGLVISSNVTLGEERPKDAGVAVWFTWDGAQVCIPVDRYLTVEANLQAIHHIIDARRVELRHGTLALVRATFTGFAALPAPSTKRHWREVMAPADSLRTRAEVDARYKALARMRHPDHGGSDAMMSELNRARDEALKEIGNG